MTWLWLNQDLKTSSKRNINVTGLRTSTSKWWKTSKTWKVLLIGRVLRRMRKCSSSKLGFITRLLSKRLWQRRWRLYKNSWLSWSRDTKETRVPLTSSLSRNCVNLTRRGSVSCWTKLTSDILEDSKWSEYLSKFNLKKSWKNPLSKVARSLSTTQMEEANWMCKAWSKTIIKNHNLRNKALRP